MAEAVFHSTQIGPESTFGTSVPATTILPLDAGSGYAVLDRASEIPDEDYGRAVRNAQAGRGSTGVRLVTGSMAAPACFQNIGHLLEMCLAPEVAAGSGPYTHTHTGISTSDTLVNHTIEINNDLQDFELVSATITRFTLGFDRLSAPGNAMWHWSADFQAADMVKAAATGSLTVPTLETMEGHLTILSEGSIATAFGSLSALTTSLERYELTIENPRTPRVTGSASTDIASGWGLGKRLVTVSADLKFTSTTVTNMFDIYNVAGSVPTERRWRITIDGSGNNAMTIDHQLQFKPDVSVEESDGEIIMSVEAEAVYNSTLASDLVIVDTNDVSALP